MSLTIQDYNNNLQTNEKNICDILCAAINKHLKNAESKIWHAHPVWFINENPIVGYSIQKRGVRLMFWSGADFEEEKLNIIGKKFKDASIFYNEVAEIEIGDLKRWLKKSNSIQWDYKNIVKRKGLLIKL